MKNTIRNTVLALLIGIFCVASGTAFAQEKSQLDTVLARGKLIVGVSSESPPFGFIDDKGQLVGFDVDLAKLIARSMFGGKENIEFVKQPFSARWANVNTGKVDFGIQITSIYPDRLLNVAFTRSYIDSGLAIITRNDGPLKSAAQLNDSKYTVAILTAPNEKDLAQRDWPKANAVTFDSTASEFTAVQTKRADAAVVDLPVAQYYAKITPGFHVLPGLLSDPTNNAIFMKPGDFKWWYYLDAMVGEMRGGSLYSQYAQIYKKWFGIMPSSLHPSAATGN